MSGPGGPRTSPPRGVEIRARCLCPSKSSGPKAVFDLPVPDYQSLMLPLLMAVADLKDHSMTDMTETLASEFKLTPIERAQALPSGRQSTFENRVGWARTYMKKAGLLDSPGRGTIRITPRGLDILKEKVGRIDVKFLMRYPEFVEFRKVTREGAEEREI